MLEVCNVHLFPLVYRKYCGRHFEHVVALVEVDSRHPGLESKGVQLPKVFSDDL